MRAATHSGACQRLPCRRDSPAMAPFAVRIWILIACQCLRLVVMSPRDLSDDSDLDDMVISRNMTSMLHPDTNTYLHNTQGLYPYNETLDLSRLDDFDHTHFEDSKESGSTERSAADALTDPVFDNNLVTNVSTQLGGTAFLHCRVRNLGQRPVSWIRRRDWHILSSGAFAYTNDERFQVVHMPGSDDWTLQIKYVQKRDNGTYECQVATGRGTISHYFNLHVVVPAAFILGTGEYHIGEGSTISLVCIIENSPAPPQYVFWYHNGQLVSQESARGGITVNTEPGPKTHSRLLVTSATIADSGNYTCTATNTEPDTIYVFISRGDNTAAIQGQDSSAVCQWTSMQVFVVTMPLWLWVSR